MLERDGVAGGRKRQRREGETGLWMRLLLRSEGLWALATGCLGTHHNRSPHLSCYVLAQCSGTFLPSACIPISPDQPSQAGSPSVVTQNVSEMRLVHLRPPSVPPSRPHSPAPCTDSQALQPRQPPACSQVKPQRTGEVTSGLGFRHKVSALVPISHDPNHSGKFPQKVFQEEQGMKRWV